MTLNCKYLFKDLQELWQTWPTATCRDVHSHFLYSIIFVLFCLVVFTSFCLFFDSAQFLLFYFHFSLLGFPLASHLPSTPPAWPWACLSSAALSTSRSTPAYLTSLARLLFRTLVVRLASGLFLTAFCSLASDIFLSSCLKNWNYIIKTKIYRWWKNML